MKWNDGVLGHDSALQGYTRSGTPWDNDMNFVILGYKQIVSVSPNTSIIWQYWYFLIITPWIMIPNKHSTIPLIWLDLHLDLLHIWPTIKRFRLDNPIVWLWCQTSQHEESWSYGDIDQMPIKRKSLTTVIQFLLGSHWIPWTALYIAQI